MLHRILDPRPVDSLADHVRQGGGRGLGTAAKVEPEALIDEVTAAGLRGRGGAGFPTGRKWAALAPRATCVVVNAAEGEPGTFKDRMIIRRNPFRLLEGALIAARAVGAPKVRIGLPASFRVEITRLGEAIGEVAAAGWTEGVDLGLLLGPESYLFGEETAMLEVLDGRQPFPRVAPPHLDPDAPALVNNAETIANVAGIIANGADWYRRIGTDASPGTVVCTVSGDVANHGVAEFAMGTTLSEVVERIGWRLRAGEVPLMVLNGVANAPIPGDRLDTPLTHEDMSAVGSGLGSASFIVIDEQRDPLAVAEGVARFLEVESCGQCEPCKRDGLAIADHLRVMSGVGSARAQDDEVQHDDLLRRLDTVATGARCNLARQTEGVVGSIMAAFGSELDAGRDGRVRSAEPFLVAPISDIVGGRAVIDESQATKQPDWTHDERDSGTWPAARLEDTPVHISMPPPAGDADPGERRDGQFSENPFEMVAHDHAVIDTLFEVVRQHPDDHDAVEQLGRELRDHCDMGASILAPMVGRYAGAAGDDATYGPLESDRRLAVESRRLAEADLPDPEVLESLAGEFADHVRTEDEMLDLLRRSMDPDELRDLALAMVEAEFSTPG